MKVIVIGGGVAGSAAAVALRRIGAEVTVYETRTDPAGPVGSFLSLAVNGLRALEALNCREPVRRAGFAVSRQRMWSGGGRLLGDVPRGRLSDDPLHSVTLMRGDLVAALRAEAVRSGADVVTGRRLVAARTAGGGVRAEFADGSAVTADLLVGADGIWSATRTAVAPAAPAPAYAGIYSVSGITEGLDLGELGAEHGTFNMTFARNGVFAHIVAPDGALWWSAQVASARPPELGGVGDDRWRERLAGTYRFERVPRAVIAAATRLHRPTLMHTLAEVPTWHGERIVLIGDAAHPVGAGQGASMALEDAVVLGGLLAAAGSAPDVPAAFERKRRPRVAKMIEAAAQNRDAKTAGPIGRRVRALVMPFFFRYGYERSTAWLYTHDLEPLTTAGVAGP